MKKPRPKLSINLQKNNLHHSQIQKQMTYFLEKAKFNLGVNTNIPNCIHIIWIGSLFPEKYFKNLFDMMLLKDKCGLTLNVWVEKELDFHLAMNKFKIAEQNHPIYIESLIETLNLGIHKGSIKVRSIKELESLILEANIKNKLLPELNFAMIMKIITILNTEIFGVYYNYAAAADIYRYLILYILGGIYIDIDNKILSYYDNRYIMQNPLILQTKLGFLYHSINYQDFNNDLLASHAFHPILKILLQKIYNIYRKSPLEDIDKKRSIFDTTLLKNRRDLTIKFTGPQMLSEAIQDFETLVIMLPVLDQYNSNHNTNFTTNNLPHYIRSMIRQEFKFHQDGDNITEIFGLFKILSKSDQNWLCYSDFKSQSDESFVNASKRFKT